VPKGRFLNNYTAHQALPFFGTKQRIFAALRNGPAVVVSEVQLANSSLQKIKISIHSSAPCL
jgi:hypothetical protein